MFVEKYAVPDADDIHGQLKISRIKTVKSK